MVPGVKGRETKISVKQRENGYLIASPVLCPFGTPAMLFSTAEKNQDKNQGMSNQQILWKFRAKRLMKKGHSKGKLGEIYA